MSEINKNESKKTNSKKDDESLKINNDIFNNSTNKVEMTTMLSFICYDVKEEKLKNKKTSLKK